MRYPICNPRRRWRAGPAGQRPRPMPSAGRSRWRMNFEKALAPLVDAAGPVPTGRVGAFPLRLAAPRDIRRVRDGVLSTTADKPGRTGATTRFARVTTAVTA